MTTARCRTHLLPTTEPTERTERTEPAARRFAGFAEGTGQLHLFGPAGEPRLPF